MARATIASLFGGALLATLLLGLWATAGRWRFPDLLPESFTSATLTQAMAGIGRPFAITLLAAVAATSIGLVLAIGCLEHWQRQGRALPGWVLSLLYLPLVVPQIGLLLGIQLLLLQAGLDGSPLALVGTHLLFVLPYLFLALALPYARQDPRYALQAACLGIGPLGVFMKVKLPMLLRPVLAAAAIGFAVSVGLYLPTLFAGGGRLPTLTTEAVALATGADRRLAAVYAFIQAGLPLAGFALALLVPRIVMFRGRGV